MKILIILFLFFSFSICSFAQENVWGITAYGGTAIPTGGFADFYNSGYTFSGGAIYSYKFSTRIAVTLGYSKWELDETAFNNALQTDSLNISFKGEAPVRVIPLLLQVKWYSTSEGIKPYALIEGGFYFSKSEFTGEVFEADTLAGNISGSNSSTNTGITLGLGLSFDLFENVELDVAGRYHIVSLNNSYNFIPVNLGSTISSDQYWSITAGVNIILIE
jgi:opacity protein-like surface antigen